MIGTVPGEDLISASVHPGDLNGIFVGICTSVGEEHLAHIVRHPVDYHFRQQAPGLYRIAGGHITELLCLLLDGIDDPPVAVSHIQVH